ncbi:MAG: PQQ-binding-like beta-propeller repeat protein [Gemmatimonadota bacterium]|nr:PQQ-binding-like beta-propeller repeat protein [Gemmatimonadota bacterium]
MRSFASLLAEILALSVLLSAVSSAQVTTAQFGNDRAGAVTTERVLTPGNVRSSTFGKVATFQVDGDVYAQPLYVPRLDLRSGTHDVLFVATEHGSIYAFDASSRGGSPLWKTSFIDPSIDITPVSFRDANCPFIKPEIGITPTPVIDAGAGTMYVLMRTKEPTTSGDHRFVQRLHALNIRTGAEQAPPVEIRASVKGSGSASRGGAIDFDPLRENPRATLLLDRGVVYLSWASTCDVGPYHGWIIAYDAKTLKQLGVFNATPGGSEAGIWQGDAGLAADSAGNVYAVTGNGTFDDQASPADYGNTVLKLALTPNGFVVRDYFTPSDQAELSSRDLDLGSSGPVLFSDESGSRRRLLFVTGKAGVSYLINRDRMGHYRPADDGQAVQTLKTSGSGFGASAYWNHTLYVWGSNDVLKAYRIVGGKMESSPALGPTISADPGATPVVSANGLTNGIIWAIQTRTWRGADRQAVLHAYDASDVRRELYNSEMNASRDRAGTALRFAMPTVADGRVFVGAKGEVNVYGLLGDAEHALISRSSQRSARSSRSSSARVRPSATRRH